MKICQQEFDYVFPYWNFFIVLGDGGEVGVRGGTESHPKGFENKRKYNTKMENSRKYQGGGTSNEIGGMTSFLGMTKAGMIGQWSVH